MAADHPTRFGFFAALLLPDVKTSLAELAHAVDVLRCDGVSLMTNYGDRYLGDPNFTPLFDELNRRRVAVYVHPNTCSCGLDVLPKIPAAMIEFPHSTTRTIVSLLYGDTFARCPDVRFIFSHAGGTIPFLANRISRQGALIGKPGWMTALQRLYYDTANSANLSAFLPLLRLVTSKQVLLGTDFPFVSADTVKATVSDLQTLGLSNSDLQNIEAGNAGGLFPRFVG
jgi:predicted TIM-barrel fold metal-dependent hydrolase